MELQAFNVAEKRSCDPFWGLQRIAMEIEKAVSGFPVKLLCHTSPPGWSFLFWYCGRVLGRGDRNFGVKNPRFTELFLTSRVEVHAFPRFHSMLSAIGSYLWPMFLFVDFFHSCLIYLGCTCHTCLCFCTGVAWLRLQISADSVELVCFDAACCISSISSDLKQKAVDEMMKQMQKMILVCMSECKARVLVFFTNILKVSAWQMFYFVMHFLMIDLYRLYLVENTCLRLKSTGGFSHKVTGKPELDGKGSKLFFESVSLQPFGTKCFFFSPISAELHENEYIGNPTREGKMVQFWNLSVQELYEVFEERVLPLYRHWDHC